MKTLTLAITLLLTSIMFSQADELNVGDTVPAVTVLNQNNEKVDMGTKLADGITMVFFYPMADTPGCTKQACSMRDSFEELQAQGVKVFGVSYDSAEAQAKFKDKYSLPYDLIADTEKKLSKAFGNDRAMRAPRQAYIVEDGVVIWRDLKASTSSQAADVKQALTDLGKMKFASLSS